MEGPTTDAVTRHVRPSLLFLEWSLFPSDADDDDDWSWSVEQGNVGNCWLVAALMALARDRDLVRGLFRSFDVEAGTYSIALHDLDGKPEIVEVDDALAVIETANGRLIPEYMQCPEGVIWAALVEKAVAQRMGGILKLDGGKGEEAFRILTGKPCLLLLPHDLVPQKLVGRQQESFPRIYGYVEKRFPITFSCQKENLASLRDQHVYVLHSILKNDQEPLRSLVAVLDPNGGLFQIPFDVLIHSMLTMSVLLPFKHEVIVVHVALWQLLNSYS